MAEFIIIRARQSGGKTTTTGLVYQALLQHSTKEHKFNDEIVTQDSLKFDSEGNTRDFLAILTIKDKRIGILSAGDYAYGTKDQITKLININIDIIICCARSINKKGSTYRMLRDEFSQTNKIALELFTEFVDDKTQKYEIKKTVVDTIVKKVLEIVG